MSAPLQVYQPHLVPFGPEEVLTVRQMVDVYLKVTESKQTPNVFSERKRLLELFCADHGALPAVHVRKCQVEDWLFSHPDWKSDWTLKRVLGTLQTVFSWAAKGDRIERNPIAGMSHPAGERGRPLELAEFAALMRTTKPLFRRVLVFMRFTGCRPCEMSKLEWSMLDLERGCIVLTEHKSARSRKDRAPRVIVLHPVVIKLLISICAGQKGPRKFVFLNSRGKQWNKNSLGLRIWNLREKLGLPKSVKLYGTRHLFATQFILNDGDLKVLAELLGHSTTRMSEHYVHIAGKIGHLEAALLKSFGKKE